jgi:HEAT repeats
MTRSLSRCQFVAFGSGILLCVAFVGAALLLRPLGESLYQINGLLALVVHYTAIILVPAAFAFVVAKYSRRHDTVAFITTATPAILVIVFGYLFDIHTKIESAAHHAMTGGVIGYADPLDVPGQIQKAFFPLLWALIAGVIGIGAKRLFIRSMPVEGAEPEAKRSGRPFLILVGVLGACLVVGLAIFAWTVAAKNTPEARVASARAILESPKSTVAQRGNALWDIGRLRADGVIPLLQQAAKDQPYPLNILAAANLAWRNDISALPILEEEMMKSSTLKYDGGGANLGAFLRRIQDPAAVPSLTRLMRSQDAETRQSAAYALRHIGDEAAIEPLIAGLDDSDQNVRWTSVLGLAEIVGHRSGGQSWAPADDTFKQNEQPYLDHWKEWAAKRKANGQR